MRLQKGFGLIVCKASIYSIRADSSMCLRTTQWIEILYGGAFIIETVSQYFANGLNIKTGIVQKVWVTKLFCENDSLIRGSFWHYDFAPRPQRSCFANPNLPPKPLCTYFYLPRNGIIHSNQYSKFKMNCSLYCKDYKEEIP